jgi:hypothetical protein
MKCLLQLLDIKNNLYKPIIYLFAFDLELIQDQTQTNKFHKKSLIDLLKLDEFDQIFLIFFHLINIILHFDKDELSDLNLRLHFSNK